MTNTINDSNNRDDSSRSHALPGSPFEVLGREMLNDLYQSGEGFDDMDFLETWMHRAAELGLLSKVKASPDSEFYFFWLRNWVNNGDTDRKLLMADGEIEENKADAERMGYELILRAEGERTQFWGFKEKEVAS